MTNFVHECPGTEYVVTLGWIIKGVESILDSAIQTVILRSQMNHFVVRSCDFQVFGASECLVTASVLSTATT